MEDRRPRRDQRQANIAIVGPCAAGKTTLVDGLRAAGLNARQISQEHSYVPQMWQRISPPDLLIFLDASYAVCQSRRMQNWIPADHAEQQHRLRHARQHCDHYVDSDDLSPDQVLEHVLQLLGVGHT